MVYHLIMKQIKLVEIKKFEAVVCDSINKIFIIHVAYLIYTNILLSCRVQVALLI